VKAVMPEVPQQILNWRKRCGADQWDEMWEGVLHMPPAPNRDHQALEGALERWLWTYWAEPRGARVYHQINVASVGGWPSDYRIPDLVLLTPDRFHIDRNEYFEGPPLVVVEIHSPGDEAREKAPFYAELGVPEMWIIDRDAKRPEIYTLGENRYDEAPPDGEGWLGSPHAGIFLRAEPGGKLAIRRADDPDSLRLLPET